jgi:predicted nucleic acid-binding protein
VKGYLLDTNVISELRKGNRANPNVLAWFQSIDVLDELYVSVLLFGEIRSGIERIRTSDPVQARNLERWLRGLEATYADRILPITTSIADLWGRLSANDPPSVVDCLLAATAIESNLTLVTRNVRDIARTGANVLDPFQT